MSQLHPGRTKLPSTIRREVRRTLNGYAAPLAEKALAMALAGDGAALLACATLLTAANNEGLKNV